VTHYLVRRIIAMAIALFFIVTLTFFGMKIIPGGPFQSEKEMPPSIKKNIEEKYKLNAPLSKQYLDYLGRVIRWEFGPSFKFPGRSADQMIEEGFPVSAKLGALTVGFALIIGLSAGIISALRQYHWQDYSAMVLATIGFSVPSFVMAGGLQYVFAYKLNWILPAMWGSPQQAILPTLALAGLPTAMIARLMRSSMLEVLQQDYIRTAKSKGLGERVIIYRHALRNAIMPVITYLGPLIASIFTGSFVVEYIFAVPGLGRHFVTSIMNRDYTVIMGITVFYSLFLMIMNLMVDLAYSAIDPRVKLTGGKE